MTETPISARERLLTHRSSAHPPASQVGEALRAAVQHALRAQAAGSPFLASLDLAGRVRVVFPAHYPLAAVGAAMLGR